MASDPASFTATIDKWVADVPEKLTAVFRDATQTTVEIAQDNIPVDTGFARASIRASTEAMPTIDPGATAPKDGSSVPYTGTEIALTIAGADIEDTIRIGWTANYVEFLEYGTSRMPARAFVRGAAAQWPKTVSDSVAKLKR